MLYFALLSIVFGILSIACMLISVPVQAFIQKVTPNEYMSRIIFHCRDDYKRGDALWCTDLWNCLKQSNHTLDDAYYYNFDDDDYNWFLGDGFEEDKGCKIV